MVKTIRKSFRDLPISRTPVLKYCRQLIKEGVDPDTRLEIFRDNPDPDIIVKSIGGAAMLTVVETPLGPRFKQYQEFPEDFDER